MRLVSDPEAAEDIVQEQFVYIWENRHRLTPIYSIKAYLYKAVKNRSLNHLKKQFNKNKLVRLDEFTETPQTAAFPSASELLESSELETILEKALENLPIRCRTIFTMKKFAELSNKEIAGHLNISVKTVEAQITIAIRKMSAYLSANWCLFLFMLFN
jgi:RNA polymerase sigma-70 factor (ECF subfamily)